MKKWFMEMMSSSNAASCTRFCVVAVLGTILANYTFTNVVMVARGTGVASIEITELVALLGLVALKVGQKKLEARNE